MTLSDRYRTFILVLSLTQFCLGLASAMMVINQVPQLAKVLVSLDTELSALHRLLFQVSDFSIRLPWLYLGLVIGISIFLVGALLRAREKALLGWGATVYAAGTVLLIFSWAADASMKKTLAGMLTEIIAR